MKKKRERLEIIKDVLIIINSKRGIGPTKILHKSNLSPQMFKEYINELIDKKFICEKRDGKKRTFNLTLKGHEFLNEYRLIESVIKNFGL